MALPGRDFEMRTRRLRLRPTRPEDTDRFVEIQSNWNVTKMLRMAPWPVDPAEMTAWVHGHAAEWAAGTAYRFSVEAEGRLIGMCDLDEIEAGRGDLGYWYDEAAWGMGYAREAAEAVFGFARRTIGLARLRSGHAADNPASGKVLVRLGFAPLAEEPRFSRPRGCDIAYRPYMFGST